MQRRSVVIAVAVGAALVLPARSHAVDHVVLDISPTRIAPLVSAKTAVAAWRLGARVVGRDFYRPGDPEIFGVTLSRTLAGRRGDELHAFRAAPRQTVVFDGERGRWTARFGSALAVRMDIAASGAPQPADAPLPCRGSFARVPVTLRGTFALRTGTRFFGTIRRVMLRGVVSFGSAGDVDCTPLPASVCERSTTLSVSHRMSETSDATLLMSRDEGGWTTLSFADRSSASSAGYTWYHVMYALGFDPLGGQLPTIAAHLPTTEPIVGSGTFTAQQSSSETRGACRTVSTLGTFTGAFRASFAGWGARTVRFDPADSGRYAENQ
jgi:hypothetical protein